MPYVPERGETLQAELALGTEGALTLSSPAYQMPRSVQRSMVTAMQAGHGWVTNGGGISASNLNDTSTSALGSQSAFVTSNGAAGQCRLRKTAGTNFDLTGKQIRIWLKIDDITHASSMSLVCGNATFANTFFFPIWTAGAAGASSYIQSGEWISIVINFQDNQTGSNTGSPVRATVTDWQIGITDDNTGNPVTMHFGGLAVEPVPTTFANGVCSVVFDDGFASQFTTARPIMDALGFAGTHYVICDVLGTGGVMTVAQLTQLQELSRAEIAGHSFANAVHTLGYPAFTLPQIEADLAAMRAFLFSNGFRGYDHLAYPHGDFNPTILPLIGKYHRSARTILSSPEETMPPANPLRLRCKTVLNTSSTASLQTLVDNAFAQQGWLILLFHDIATTASASTQYSTANFTTVMNYLSTKPMPVLPVGDVLRAIGVAT